MSEQPRPGRREPNSPRWLRKGIEKASRLGVAEEKRLAYALVQRVWDRLIAAYYWTLSLSLGTFGLFIAPGVIAVKHVAPAFYQTSATIIPVLALTLAIQQRFFQPPRLVLRTERQAIHGMPAGWGYQLAAVLVLGEVCSLYVLTGTDGSRLTLAAAAGALVGGGFAALVAPLIRASPEDEQWASQQPNTPEEWLRGDPVAPR